MTKPHNVSLVRIAYDRDNHPYAKNGDWPFEINAGTHLKRVVSQDQLETAFSGVRACCEMGPAKSSINDVLRTASYLIDNGICSVDLAAQRSVGEEENSVRSFCLAYHTLEEANAVAASFGLPITESEARREQGQMTDRREPISS